MSVRTLAARPTSDADCIVIGSGMAGLSCAATLAGSGLRVLVLEQHDVAGGSTHSFKQGTESISAGWHYIGKLRGPARLVWDDITNFCALRNDPEEVYDRAVLADGREIALKHSNFEEQMGISIKHFRRVDKLLTYYVLVKLLPLWAAWLVWAFFVITGKKKEATMNYVEWCRRVSGRRDDEKLSAWLMQRGDHGMAPDETIAIVHCIITAHYYSGTSHPECGVSGVTARICDVIRARGGCVLVKARVETILVDPKSGAATGVRMETGEVLTAPRVVCSGAYLATQLLKRPPRELVRVVEALGPGAAHGCAFLTYAGKSASDLGLPTGNVWMPDAGCFVSYKESPSGTAVYIIWESAYIARGAGYEEAKEEAIAKYTAAVFAWNPRLQAYDQLDGATPATTEHYLASWRGSSYGLSQKAARFDNFATVRALRPETSVKGVWLTGQDTLMPGVVTAMMEGALTAQAILYPGLQGLRNNVFKDAHRRNRARYDADPKSKKAM